MPNRPFSLDFADGAVSPHSARASFCVRLEENIPSFVAFADELLQCRARFMREIAVNREFEAVIHEFLQDFARNARRKHEKIPRDGFAVEGDALAARLRAHRHHQVERGLHVRHQRLLAANQRNGHAVLVDLLDVHILTPCDAGVCRCFRTPRSRLRRFRAGMSAARRQLPSSPESPRQAQSGSECR